MEEKLFTGSFMGLNFSSQLILKTKHDSKLVNSFPEKKSTKNFSKLLKMRTESNVVGWKLNFIQNKNVSSIECEQLCAYRNNAQL